MVLSCLYFFLYITLLSLLYFTTLHYFIYFLSKRKEICIPLIDCINSAILNVKFPFELKMADVTPIFKKGNPLKKQIIIIIIDLFQFGL